MMISNQSSPTHQAYVWVWLPNQTEPVVAGQIVQSKQQYLFTYGRSYRNHPNAIPLSPFELPLRAQTFFPEGMNDIHSCLRDAGPDAWGRRLIDFQYPKLKTNELDYLLLSGSERIGALDFQTSPATYAARDLGVIDIHAIDILATTIENDLPFHANLAPIFL